jgi:CBS domain containing-hemolysin-like protein
MALSLVSGQMLDGVGYSVSVPLLLLFILLNIVFDIVGMAVATASEKPFHSMSSRRVKGAQEALWLIRRADKVSNFCSDVVGDICGILSGTTSVVVALLVADDLGVSLVITQFIVSGLVAALTVGGKAVGKSVGMEQSTKIMHLLGRTLCLFFRVFHKSNDGR